MVPHFWRANQQGEYCDLCKKYRNTYLVTLTRYCSNLLNMVHLPWTHIYDDRSILNLGIRAIFCFQPESAMPGTTRKSDWLYQHIQTKCNKIESKKCPKSEKFLCFMWNKLSLSRVSTRGLSDTDWHTTSEHKGAHKSLTWINNLFPINYPEIHTGLWWGWDYKCSFPIIHTGPVIDVTWRPGPGEKLEENLSPIYKICRKKHGKI